MTTDEITLELNGEERTMAVEPGVPLRDALREELGLTGTKGACEVGECGACMVLLEDRAVKSCLIPAHQADGKDVTTVEGLAARADRSGAGDGEDGGSEDEGEGRDLHPVQEGFIEEFGLQCGYCTPGFIISSVSLLEDNPDPTREEISERLEGNLCRCTGYTKIFDAVEYAAEQYDG